MAASEYLEEQLRLVSSAFVAHLQKKLQQIETVWALLESGDVSDPESLQKLSDIAHELHGQGAFFGYPEVTECAGVIEELLEMFILRNDELSTEARHAISDHIEQLKRTAGAPKTGEELFGNDLEALSQISDTASLKSTSDAQPCILLVDDAEVMRQKIAIALRQAGYEVLEARDGATGITLAYQRTPDLILLDIKMPEINGFEVQRTIRLHEDLSDVPIVFLTSLGRVSIAQIQEALSYGISDYITKPFKMDRLIAKVRQTLEKGR